MRILGTGGKPPDPETVLENFYSATAEFNDLSDQSFANTDTYSALADQLEIQGDAQDYFGIAATFRETAGMRLRQVSLAQQQIDFLDSALAKCQPEELVEFLKLHRNSAEIMRDAFAASASRDQLLAEAVEAEPGSLEDQQLLRESEEAEDERSRLEDELEEADSRRMHREDVLQAACRDHAATESSRRG